MVLASKTDFGAFQTDRLVFRRDLRASKAKVWDFGCFLLLLCVTTSSIADHSQFLFVKASGVSFYQFLLISLL